jgi:Glycosyl transferase family 2
MTALSIVLATTHPWPDAKPTLDAIFGGQAVDGLEVVLCDGDGDGAPPSDARDPRLKVIVGPGESVFALRARGVGMAKGEIVGITEDHCVPTPDWPRELMAAHARHPEAVAIAGAVTNGSTERAWDWANFLMTFADHLPPMPDRRTVRAPSVANGSVKRALAEIPADPAPGWFETELMGRLMSAGLVVRDDGPRVSHVQTHGGPLATLVAHFHNGRATAGLRAQPPGPRALLAERGRIARLPLRLVREARGALAARPPLPAGSAVRGARIVPLIAAAHAVGELTGLLAGPGRSAELLD